MILNGTLKSARYFVNEIFLDDDKTHIWLQFEYSKDMALVVFVYPHERKKNKIYPHSSSALGAQISIGDKLFSDIKSVVLNQTAELHHVGIVLGSDDLTEDLHRNWFSSDDDFPDAQVAIDELSISFAHPNMTAFHEELMSDTNDVLQPAKDLTEKPQR